VTGKQWPFPARSQVREIDVTTRRLPSSGAAGTVFADIRKLASICKMF
jgi:hypothetical protein